MSNLERRIERIESHAPKPATELNKYEIARRIAFILNSGLRDPAYRDSAVQIAKLLSGKHVPEKPLKP